MWVNFMKCGRGRQRVTTTGTDTGLLLLIGSHAGPRYDATVEPDLQWPTLVLKDGRRFRAGGHDFFHWDHVLDVVGKSPNELVSSGEAEVMESKGARLGKLDYNGACAAADSVGGFGYIGDGREEGVVFHVGIDGGYPVWKMSNCSTKGQPMRQFAYVGIRGGDESDDRKWLVPIGGFRTLGEVSIDDPCQGGLNTFRVKADADGDSVVYGEYIPGQSGLSGFAIEMA